MFDTTGKLPTKENVFSYMCSVDAAPFSWWGITPARLIAERFNTNIQKIYKVLHNLKDDGLVVVDTVTTYDSFYGKNIVMRGFALTDKARQLDEWKKFAEEYEKSISNMFGEENS